MFQGKGMFWGHLGQHPFFVLKDQECSRGTECMFQGKGMFWGHLGQHPFFVLLVVDQFSGQLVKKQGVVKWN